MQLSDFTPNTQFLSGSLFSFRFLELLRREHFGEDGLRDTAGIYFRDDIFPLTVGKPVCCQTLHSVIRTGALAETMNSCLAAGALPQTVSVNISR